MQENSENITGLITDQEMELAVYCMEAALRHGADQVRISLSKSVLDSYGMLNGELDKVAHSADRSIYLYVFADQRYGTFSTNNLEKTAIDDFAAKAVASAKLLAEDECRQLPAMERVEKGALTGRELQLFDPAYGGLSSEEKYHIAAGECIVRPGPEGSGQTSVDIAPEGTDKMGMSVGIALKGTVKIGRKKLRVVSEECEYSDSVDDNFTIDSQGFRGRHTETSFSITSELTIQDGRGRKYSGYWWEASPFLSGLRREICSKTALEMAARQINPRRHGGGRLKMVVDRTVSSRLVSPLFAALNSSAIQQESSFLKDSLGKCIFNQGLSIVDLARTPGKAGARLFDSEGVATRDGDIVRDGVVKMYFTNTYMGLKMGIEPSVEGVSRPVLLPFGGDSGEGDGFGEGALVGGLGNGSDLKGSFGAEEIIKRCGSGIYVTGFNGGNCNPATGNFSYGIEGFAFEDGKITHPVREMVITGDMIGLWQKLIFAGDDGRDCTRWQIPSIAFGDVDFC